MYREVIAQKKTRSGVFNNYKQCLIKIKRIHFLTIKQY